MDWGTLQMPQNMKELGNAGGEILNVDFEISI
jgi:hypothetical protein